MSKGTQNAANLNVDASKLPTLKCIRCGNFTFSASYVIKKISALISPSGKETVAPIQVFTCTACATILPLGNGDELDFIKDVMEEQKEEKPEEPKSNLIL